MNNNFNQMGQFGEQTSPFGHFKKSEKKKLKTIGRCCGLAVIYYIGLSMILEITLSIFPVISENVPSLALDIVITVLVIGVPFFLAHLVFKKKRISTKLPFGKTKDKKEAIYLVMMFLPVMVVGAIIINYISACFQSLIGVEFTSAVNSIKLVGLRDTLIGIVSIAVVPALIEEITIRGIIMQPLRKYGDMFAIITSALVFACMHGNLIQIPYTVIGGLLMGYLVVATGSLWPSIILHFINNLYSVIVMTTNDNFGDTVSMISVFVMIFIFVIVGIIGVIKYKKVKYSVELYKNEELLTTREKVIAFLGNVPIIIAIILLSVIVKSNIKF